MTLPAAFAHDHEVDLDDLAFTIAHEIYLDEFGEPLTFFIEQIESALRKNFEGCVILQVEEDEISHAAPTLPNVASLCGDKRRVG